HGGHHTACRSRAYRRYAMAAITRPAVHGHTGDMPWRPSHGLPFTGIPAVVVVRGAGTLGRHHARPDRVLGRARGTEHLALPWLDHALEHLSALAGFGICNAHARNLEAVLGVELPVGVRQT